MHYPEALEIGLYIVVMTLGWGLLWLCLALGIGENEEEYPTHGVMVFLSLQTTGRINRRMYKLDSQILNPTASSSYQHSAHCSDSMIN